VTLGQVAAIAFCAMWVGVWGNFWRLAVREREFTQSMLSYNEHILQRMHEAADGRGPSSPRVRGGKGDDALQSLAMLLAVWEVVPPGTPSEQREYTNSLVTAARTAVLWNGIELPDLFPGPMSDGTPPSEGRWATGREMGWPGGNGGSETN
jgi:hypothetical protein